MFCKGLKPEVFFKPQEVWEIRGAECVDLLEFNNSPSNHSHSITLSPVSVAAKGLVSDTRGLSIRFPRFLRIRADKMLDQASTPHFLASMYRAQQQTTEIGADAGELLDPEESSALESEVDDVE
jgi:DNA ligase 1